MSQPECSKQGVKRGPYRARDKPNWNKEIVERERAEKKAAQKKQKRAEARQRRVKPPKAKSQAPLTALPVEVLDIIVANILPTAHPLADYLPSPGETPYPPLSQNITASAQARFERWGSIPQRVLDIINFGKCCRQTMGAVERVVGGLGGNTATMNVDIRKASTLDEVRSDEKRQLFLRLSHCQTSADDVFAFAMRSRVTLEHMVIYNCGEDHNKLDRHQPEVADASPINRTKPLQLGHPADFVPLPLLRSLQIGPDVCLQCSQACLHLLTGRTFFSKPAEEHAQTPQFVLTRTYAGWNGGWTGKVYDKVAAPHLEAVQIHVMNPALRSRHYGSSYSEVFKNIIDNDLRKSVKTFSLILPATERKWGGFGVSGHSSSVRQKLKEAVEKELSDRARAEIVAPGLSNQPKRNTLDERVKEKWAASAKAALVKPAPHQSRVAAEAGAVAAALVSSIKPLKAKSPIADPPSATLDPPPVTLDSLAHQTTSPPSSDADSSQPPRHPPPAKEGTTTATGYDGKAIANRAKLHHQFKMILLDIAEAFPNLVSLQLLRRGNARVDIVEDLMPIEEYAEVYVTPLRKLHRLEHLDLGLAVVGRREVRDFPLGLALPTTAPDSNLAVALELGIRKRILDRDVAQAIREGDAWRKKVLERFVLGTGEDVEGEEDSGFAFANPPVNLAAASEEAAQVKLPSGWPTGVRTGFVYSADIQQRAMFNGVLTTWEQGTESWRGPKGKDTLVTRKRLVTL